MTEEGKATVLGRLQPRSRNGFGSPGRVEWTFSGWLKPCTVAVQR